MWHGTAWLLFLSACAGAATPASGKPDGDSGSACAVIEREANVAACVGKTVTLRGKVSDTKIPMLLGVDVADESLAGERAEATGVLETYTIPADVDPHSAHKSPGMYHRLSADDGLAKPRPAK